MSADAVKIIREVAKRVLSAVPVGLAVGQRFHRERRFLEASQWWSPEQMERYQVERLRELLGHAGHNVPYYRDLFRKLGFEPGGVRSLKDLQALPLLTKDIVRAEGGRLLAENKSERQRMRLNTSGTTGRPLHFYCDRDREYLHNDPYVWRYFGWGGHRLGERRATLSAWTLPEGRCVEYNPLRRLLILSVYRLNRATAPRYAEALARHGIEFIDAYPSSMEFLTRLLREQEIRPPVALKAIFSNSEYLYPWQREQIESYWGCKCFDWYGMEERVIMATECERHEGLHLLSDFSIVECVESPEAPAGWQRLVATSLNNSVMPFIRYDTGDLGRLAPRRCSCGRCFPLIELAGGRTRNFAVGKDGSRVSITVIDIPSVTENVLQFQFVQEAAGRMTLSVIPKPSFGEADVARIRAKLAEKFGGNMEVDIRTAEAVERTKNNKTPLFIQRIAAASSPQAAQENQG